MCGDQTFRIIIKQVTGVPTIPVSTDHRNGDWLPTDIYEGEQAMDVNTGIVYTRSANGIEAVGGGGGSIQPKIYKAQISQTGTNAPTLVELINTLGVGTLTPSYGGVGDYSISGFGGVLTGLIDVSIKAGYDEIITTSINCTTSSIIRIKTFISGVAANDLLLNSGITVGTSVITIIKYD